MPSWIETKREIEERKNDFDGVRRERIRRVEEITGRPLVIYATDFLNRDKATAARGEVTIDGKDKTGFDEVTTNIASKNLDILIHSPGGNPDSTESIVSLLRSRFDSLRFIVPDQAKSAATMMCCAGDEILMDERSELGPIDPQVVLIRGDGQAVQAPAQVIIDQFDSAKESLAQNPKHLPAWLPILQPLGPSLLSECEIADNLSRKLVMTWLTSYMLRERENREQISNEFTNFLASSKEHLSHGRRIGIEQLQGFNINVTDLREHPELRDAVWDLYLAISCTFDSTAAFKIIENSHGDAYIRLIKVQEIKIPLPQSQQEKSPAEVAEPKSSKRRRKR